MVLLRSWLQLSNNLVMVPFIETLAAFFAALLPLNLQAPPAVSVSVAMLRSTSSSWSVANEGTNRFMLMVPSSATWTKFKIYKRRYFYDTKFNATLKYIYIQNHMSMCSDEAT